MTYSDELICMEYGESSEQQRGALAPPIYQTSLFTFPTFAEFTQAQQNERQRYVYSRGVNPTVNLLEQKLSALERGEQCKCFASGMGAISAVFFSLLHANDHVVLVNNIYGPAVQLIDYMARFNISVTQVSGAPGTVESAIQDNTRLIYVESPGTMLMKVVDLGAIAACARQQGIVTAIDNTWSTPLLQKPLELGIDLTIHALTKYIGGHSDTMGGAVIGSADLVDEIFEHGYQLNGAVLGAHDAWLILRGLRTLPLRLKQHQENCRQVIDYLKTEPMVAAIHHPLMAEGCEKELAERQMNGSSGLLSFELKDADFAKVCTFIDALQLFRIGVSWGGYESLVNSPLKKDNQQQLQKSGIPAGLIRLSIGLEGAPHQISDLQQAFSRLYSH